MRYSHNIKPVRQKETGFAENNIEPVRYKERDSAEERKEVFT